MSGFRDHFSDNAAGYARFRPRYPAALFHYLASLCRQTTHAWDCATGSGQAAVALADHFATVFATDASSDQIKHAEPHARIEYRVATAEDCGLATNSVDLVCVAQALHWLDREAFYAEAQRVLRPGGIIATWCYGKLIMPDQELQSGLDDFYHRTVGPYWPAERRLVEHGYRSLAFPFAELTPPGMTMEADMSLDALIGYVGSWSATRRCMENSGTDPLPPLRDRLARHWGDPDNRRRIRWPLAMRVGRTAANP